MIAGAEIKLENGEYGRTLVARLKPNEDLIEALERLCRQYGIAHAVVRSAVGSLVDGCLAHARDPAALTRVPGPGVEIVSLTGEVRLQRDGDGAAGPTELTAILSGVDSQVFAGRVVRGANLSFITVECVLQEWLPQTDAAPSSPS